MLEDVIQAMREWVRDCEWGDVDEDDIEDLDDLTIVRGVDRHYEGGILGFIQDTV